MSVDETQFILYDIYIMQNTTYFKRVRYLIIFD